MTSPLTDVLPRLLAEVQRPGDFCAHGGVQLPVLRLEVDGLGPLGLPIMALAAEALLARSRPAPYGRGAATLIDPSVRRCGQIDAAAVTADDPRWTAVLSKIVAAAAHGLGVEGPVRAELYKMLIYQPGDFFVEHRDTEKAPRMFATLVVVLPGRFAGGELVVRHDGREATLDLQSDDLGEARWAAFYADCQHELRPVTAGHRVALVYNLTWPRGRAPSVPDDRPAVRRVAAALRGWPAEAPPMVILPLRHAYTPEALGFCALKNEDEAMAAVLTRACGESGCELRLAMVSIREGGIADPIWEGRGRRRWQQDDPDAYTVVELTERSSTLTGWLHPDDSPDPMGPLPFLPEEVGPPGALDNEVPDEDHLHEATGNEGASFERTYRRAALVVFPAHRALEVLNHAPLAPTLDRLEGLLDRGELTAASQLAGLIVGRLPVPDPARSWTTRDLPADRILGLLLRVPDPGPLRAVLREHVPAGLFSADHEALTLAALLRLPDEELPGVLRRLAAAFTASRLRPVARLLLGCALLRGGAPIAGALRAACEGLRSVPPAAVAGAQRAEGSALADRPGALVALLEASAEVGDPALSAGIAATVLADPSRWPLDAVLVPAARALAGSDVAAAGAPVIAAARAQVQARAALPLAAPADATRSTDGLRCGCAPCVQLRAFLRDPALQVWNLRARVELRRHLEGEIAAARSDLRTETLAQGNPYTLVCTKTRASHEARAAQRTLDLETLASLG